MKETEVRELEVKQELARQEVDAAPNVERRRWQPFLLGLGLMVILGVIAMFLAPSGWPAQFAGFLL